MSKQDFSKPPSGPSAAPPMYNPSPNNPYFHNRPPPPSYEDSLRDTDPLIQRQPMSGYPSQQYSVNYPVNYQNQPIQQTNYMNSTLPGPSGQPPVVQFDKGARFMGKTVAIPPPPPGYGPTPGQAAAFQGQTVVLTQKKSSFF